MSPERIIIEITAVIYRYSSIYIAMSPERIKIEITAVIILLHFNYNSRPYYHNIIPINFYLHSIKTHHK